MILVTGITGHSGRFFLEELVNNKFTGKIRCIVRSTSDIGFMEDCGLDIQICVGDLTDQNFLDQAMKGIVEIVHIASIFYSINVIQSAVRHNVKRAIFVHTTGIYSKFKTASEEYRNIESRIKKIIDESNSSIKIIYLRPTMIYGNLNDRNMVIFIRIIDKLRVVPVISKGMSLLQPVNGRDLGKAYYQLLIKTEIISGDYILSGDKPITMIEMFKLISEHLNKKTFFVSVPLEIGVWLGQTLKLISFNKVDLVEKIQRMGEDRSFTHDLAQRDFHYCPMAFRDGLKIEVDEYLKSLQRD